MSWVKPKLETRFDYDTGKMRIWIIGAEYERVEFGVSVPLPYTEHNIQYVTDLALKAFAEDPALEKARAGKEERLRWEEAERQRGFETGYKHGWALVRREGEMIDLKLQQKWMWSIGYEVDDESRNRFYNDVYEYYCAGSTYKKTGKHFGFSATRASHIIAKVKRNRELRKYLEEKTLERREAGGIISDPDYTSESYYGKVEEWTIEKQYQEFNNEKAQHSD